jgi:hypothetical protein
VEWNDRDLEFGEHRSQCMVSRIEGLEQQTLGE